MNLDSLLRAELDALESVHLRRTLRAVDELPPGLLNFAANDYLGLSHHPTLIEAAREATARLERKGCRPRLQQRLRRRAWDDPNTRR